MSDPVLPGEGPADHVLPGPETPAHQAVARVRAYLDADQSSNDFGRLMPYELPDGAPKGLTRADLMTVLDGYVTLARRASQFQSESAMEFGRLKDCERELAEARSECAALAAKAGTLAGFAGSVRRAQPRSEHGDLDAGWNACLESIQDGLTIDVLAALEPASGMPRPPAQEGRGGDGTSRAGADRGTGVRETHARSDGSDLIPADLIESNPGIRGGERVMKCTRVPASDVAGLLADGLPWRDVHEYYPSVPLPDGTECTGRQCDCFADRTRGSLKPAAAAVFDALCHFNSDYAHGYDDADEMATIAADTVRPAHYREAGADLRAYVAAQPPVAPDDPHACGHRDGIIWAAERLESYARDLPSLPVEEGP